MTAILSTVFVLWVYAPTTKGMHWIPKGKWNMAAWLGRVLYWLGCAISIFVFVGTMVFVNAVADGKPNASEYVFIAFCTAVPWVIGRALRYILAGE
jgi:hypothetical protein